MAMHNRHILAGITASLIVSMIISGCSATQDSIPRAEGSEEMKAAISAYVEEAAQKDIDINSIMVIQGGKVTGEAYLNGWTAEDPHQMWSTSKSFTSFAVGFAIKEGKLSLDDKMSDIFPQEAQAVLDTLSNEEFKANLLDADIRDYLVMACGHKRDATYVLGERYAAEGLQGIDSLDTFLKQHGKNLIEEFFSVPFEEKPGTFNCYNSMATYMLSAAVQKVTGEKIVDYLYPRLFRPLGMEKPRWDEVQGINCGGWGLWLKPEDMARTGLMMLGEGRYDGRQTVPSDYLAEASESYFSWDLPDGCRTMEDRYRSTGYGYQIWQNPDAFYTAGMWGQFIYVFPELDAVVVATAEVKDDDSKESALIWKHIVPVLRKESVSTVRGQEASAYDSGNAPEKTRWSIEGDHAIAWEVESGDPGHYDHIEMSGERISVIYEYGVDPCGAFILKRNVIWPLLRKYPNNTYGHTSMQFCQDFLEGATVDGRRIVKGRTEKIILDGKLTAVSRNGRLRITRCLFPSTEKAAVCEEYTICNLSSDSVCIKIPARRDEYLTDKETGVEGEYHLIARTSHSSDIVRMLEPYGSMSFGAEVIGYRYPETEEYLDISLEKSLREAFVADVCGKLVLSTPDPVLNTMFAFAKIRGSESLFRTKGGLTHSPGGGYYYSAIWANDQAEYICPFFPFLGYAKGNEAAMNAFLHFATFMNNAFEALPSSVIAEFTDIWNGCGDRGDAAMIAYGAGRFALAYGEQDAAQRLLPLIRWCLEYCRRHLTEDGVVASDTDELENRFPSGKANLCTSSLYYDALVSASYLAETREEKAMYMEQARKMKESIESYFGAEMKGFRTYRYYDGNDLLRSWICIPLTMGIYDRKTGTADALLSSHLWTENGILTQEGSSVFWDRATLYALRGIFAAGRTEDALTHLQQYSTRRLLGEHVPYAVEAWPENDQRHLSAESGLYCRIYTEGLFGLRPTGFRSIGITPHLPEGWDRMSLDNVYACSGTPYGITVVRSSGDMVTVEVSDENGKIFSGRTANGQTISINL